MADETLKWRLLLRDSVSPGAKSARDALQGFRGELGRVAREQARLAREQARAAAQNARRMGENQRLLAAGTRTGLGLLGGLALGALGAFAGIVEGFAGMGAAAAGSVIRIAAFRESSLAALETVMGSSEAARRSFSNAMIMANQTPLDTADVVGQYQRFAVAGFAEREIAPLVAATSDIGAAFDTTAADSFALVASQMRAADRMDRGDLRQMLNAGVNTGAVLDSIARQLNIQGADERARRAAALQAITQRRVSGDVGNQAMLDAVRQRLDRGGPLGTFARRQSETLTGALSNAQNAVFNLLAGMDFSAIPGVVTFKNTLLAITAALGEGTPAAAMLRGAVSGAANAVGGLFGRIFTVQNAMGALGFVSRAFQGIGRFAAAAWPVAQAFFSAFGPGFMAGIAPLRSLFGSLMSGGPPSARTMELITLAARGIGSAIGFAAGSITTFAVGANVLALAATALLGTLAGVVTTGITSIRAMFNSIGTGIVDGIIQGIQGGIGRVGQTVAGLGRGALQSARDALGIHSPSRVFAAEVGAHIPAGIQLGIQQGAAPLDDTVAGLARPQAGGYSAGGGVVVHLTVIVQGGARNEDTGTVVGGAVEDTLERVFGRLREAHA